MTCKEIDSKYFCDNSISLKVVASQSKQFTIYKVIKQPKSIRNDATPTMKQNGNR